MFIEYLWDSIHGSWLKNWISWGIVLLEYFSSKDCNGRGNKYFCFMLSSEIQCCNCSIDINIKCFIWVKFSCGWKNGSQMNNVINLVIFNYLFVFLSICDIKLLVRAWEIHLSCTNISCKYSSIASNFISNRLDKRDTNLSIASCNQNSASTLNIYHYFDSLSNMTYNKVLQFILLTKALEKYLLPEEGIIEFDVPN